MKNKINLAIQVLPQSDSAHPYAIVDKAIEAIQKTGLKYTVCPFETVVEGYFDELMELVKQVHLACYEGGASNMMCYLKIQSRMAEDVSIEDKMEKYS
jgi:uncharacterized protein (TIGR00106 family)